MRKDHEKVIFFIFLIILAAAHIIFAYLYINVGFDRDEGFYLYSTSSFLKGVAPYRGVRNLPQGPKPPFFYILLIPIVYLAGVNIVLVRIWINFILFLTSLVIYFTGRSYLNTYCGIFGALIFCSMVFAPCLLGYLLLTELFLNLFATFIFFLLVRFKMNARLLIIVGIITGLTCCIRQTGVYLFITVLYFIFTKNKNELKKSLISFLIGIFFILTILFVILLVTSSLDEFLNLHIEYIGFFKLDINHRFNVLENVFIFIKYPAFALIFAIPFCLIKGGRILLVWLFLVLLFLQITPFNYGHYYLMAIPPMSIVISFAFVSLFESIFNKVEIKTVFRVLLLLFPAIIFTFLMGSQSFFIFRKAKKVGESGRAYQSTLSYEEELELINLIKKDCEPEDKIWVFPNEPQIYYLARKRAPNSIIGFSHHGFEKLGKEGVEKHIIKPLKKCSPKYIIINDNFHFKKFRKNESYERVDNFIKERYKFVKRINIILIFKLKDSSG